MISLKEKKEDYFKAIGAVTPAQRAKAEEQKSQVLCFDCGAMVEVPTWLIFGTNGTICRDCAKMTPAQKSEMQACVDFANPVEGPAEAELDRAFEDFCEAEHHHRLAEAMDGFPEKEGE